ncbi:MAG: MipA/OmpV family protein [Castellaniella sp.]|uniref:MipA/OmpV family protein n=1 Tax=Castellaniella hirudinis TaxID=1144617 RepID=A0ABV8RYF7_9BURK
MKFLSTRASRSLIFAPLIPLALSLFPTGAQAKNAIGLGVGIIPKYEGSEDYRALPVPLINYTNGHFFISPRAGLPSMGLKTDLTTDWSAGVFLGMALGRKASWSSRLDGTDDIDFHGVAGVYTEWRPGPFSIGAAYYQALHSGYGATAELRASYLAWKSGYDALRVGVSTQWANSDSMQTYFGVTEREAKASQGRLHPYSPSAGFKSASVFGTWNHQLSDSWSMNATLGVRTLLNHAGDSPIVEDKTGVFGSAGLMYSF